jgi:hypothetical protein
VNGGLNHPMRHRERLPRRQENGKNETNPQGLAMSFAIL